MTSPTPSPWMTEPAKMVGWAVAAVIAIAAAVLELANELLPILPGSWRDEVRQAVIVVGAIALIATRVQALLTRNGIGAPGKVFDGVYSPHTVQEAMKPSPEDMGPGGVGPAAITPPAT